MMFNNKFWNLCEESLTLEFKHCNSIWKARVPPKVQVFTWILIQGKLNKADIIQVKYHQMCLPPHQSVMCNNIAESCDHLFLYAQWLHDYEQKFEEKTISNELLLVLVMIHLWRTLILLVKEIKTNTQKLCDSRFCGLLGVKEEETEFLWDSIKFLASLWAFVSKDFEDTSFLIYPT